MCAVLQTYCKGIFLITEGAGSFVIQKFTEVKAKCQMLYTDFICNVVCMANQTIYGLFLHILVNQHIEGVQPNNPVCISDFQKLAVCQISDYICQRSCIGMGCH